MKMRNGFVSNSSSSSFLIVSGMPLKSQKDWRQLFKPEKRFRNKDFYEFESKADIGLALKSAISAIASSIDGSRFEDVRQSENYNYNLSAFAVDNWEELLKDKYSWLYEEIHNEVKMEMLDNIESLPDTSFGGNLGYGLIFNYNKNINYWRGKAEGYNLFADETIDRYIENILKSLEGDEIYMYLLNFGSDGSSEKPYQKEGMFMRCYWHNLINKNVEYFKFEHS